MISCLLTKPIYLPVLLPGNFFRSPIDRKQERLQSSSKILETDFMRAVQETNFFISFTLSSFSALCTSMTIMRQNGILDMTFNEKLVLYISISYFISGTIISVLLYGRKVVHTDQNQKQVKQSAF